jgi:hypothetical protein
MAEANRLVNRVVILYRSGLAETVKPIGGFVLYAVPKERVGAADHVVSITALDASGAKIGELKTPH